MKTSSTSTPEPSSDRIDRVLPLGRRMRSFTTRHPLVVLLVIFNTCGQAVVLLPTLAAGDAAPPLEVLQSVSLATFLLLPALVLIRISRGPEALRALMADAFRFRVRPGWYLLPLVVIPAGVMAVNLSLPRSDPLNAGTVMAAYVTGFLPALALQFLTTNWWEETVWTGVVQTQLHERCGPMWGVLLTGPWFALEHIFLTVHGTFKEGVMLIGFLTVLLVFVRAGFGWIYQRTRSLALTGLVHAASNAAVLGLANQFYNGQTDSILVLVALGVTALCLTRGRLGWPRSSDHE